MSQYVFLVTSMKIYQLHQIPIVCTMFKLQGLQQMITKQTHDSGTIIDHVYVSHTLNRIQTDVTDCYYSDHDFILCVLTA